MGAYEPAIAVAAYKRPESVERLLRSLRQACFPVPTPLVIAIDQINGKSDKQEQAANAAVSDLACHFDWPHGPKEVINHKEHLGLIGNVFFCGSLSQRFGSVILLEDDLYVSRMFYPYALQALQFYGDDPRIAGFGLNALWFNGFTRQPFIPYLDDSDSFFLQLSTPQGQVYTAKQWAAFATWVETTDTGITPADNLHELFGHFPSTDWLQTKAKYLVTTGRSYVYPRESLTTNFGDIGTHFRRPTTFFQVPLQHFRQHFRFRPLDEAVAVYDAFFEILPSRLNRLTNLFGDCHYDVDLYATKSPRQLQADYVLTSRPGHAPLYSFGKVMRPMEANVVANVPGNEIVFCRREDVATGKWATLAAEKSNYDYMRRYRQTGRRRRLNNGLIRGLRTLQISLHRGRLSRTQL
jgi:hypothetical protein